MKTLAKYFGLAVGS